MNTLLNRLYCDYAMPSRLAAHEQFVCAAHAAGYAQMSVRQFVAAARKGLRADQKIVIHRHDIDTDLRTTRKLFALEKKHGIHSSFYFRRSTLDFTLMREIEEYGSEASYHYEELATYAKRHKIKDPAAIRARLPEIRADFLTNFQHIEQRFGRKMTTVAAHGDFANRRLAVRNTEILDHAPLRARCGIDCETYDRALLDQVGIYIADRPHPHYYHPSAPHEALGRHARICLLTHPRQCETNWVANTKDNLVRFYEGATW
ncbi:MAG: hypothetical protein QFF03_02545 [Pseudomonadota bacterium]|nr:hypothetical protein [Pseudomonadota bacterium]